ncbi:hypothetical protein [Amycolatopsis sp. YIM 10]|uniref:hypothetical protein n=1 Tax=Amycolatopsis sp. YIM 10 TaxID=2653857 RepID=UPI00128FFCB0|nr:hypothetical protein [Amycolatopsis sp. YIM 10]QFU90937.1 hypothetical protein YIM_28825 [Amycolatopsis sp. YIM 10]
MTGRKDPADQGLLAVWISIAVVFSLLAAGVAGLLAWAGGLKPPAAVLTGGGAFLGFMTLGLAIIGIFRSNRH